MPYVSCRPLPLAIRGRDQGPIHDDAWGPASRRFRGVGEAIDAVQAHARDNLLEGEITVLLAPERVADPEDGDVTEALVLRASGNVVHSAWLIRSIER